MRIAGLGIDPGKNSCGVAGLDDTGRAVLRRRMQRESVITLASGMTPCVMGLLLERGMTVPQGRRKLEQHLPAVLDGDDAPLSPRLRPRIADMRAEWAALEHRLEVYDDEFAAQAETDHAARRLASIPGRVC